METKHTKEYAEQLACKLNDDYRLKSLNIDTNSFERSMFIEGYMKAIEETAAPELLEALMEILYPCEGGTFKIGQQEDTIVSEKVLNAIKKATE